MDRTDGSPAEATPQAAQAQDETHTPPGTSRPRGTPEPRLHSLCSSAWVLWVTCPISDAPPVGVCDTAVINFSACLPMGTVTS